MNDNQPSPMPISRGATNDPHLCIQQLVVGQDHQQRPYVLTITAHKETGSVTARLGQTLAFPA